MSEYIKGNEINKSRIRIITIFLILVTITFSIAPVMGVSPSESVETTVTNDSKSTVSQDSPIKNVEIESSDIQSSETIRQKEWNWLPQPQKSVSTATEQGNPPNNVTTKGSSSPNLKIPDNSFRRKNTKINSSDVTKSNIETQSAYDTVDGVLPAPTSGDSRYELTTDLSEPRTIKTVRLSVKRKDDKLDKEPKPEPGFCTGMMITQKHVLTAAHCVTENKTGVNPSSTDPVKLEVGSKEYPVIVEPGAYYSGEDTVVRPRHFAYVEKAYKYPKYDFDKSTPERFKHDIAVLTLDRPIGNKTGTWQYLVDPPEENYKLSDTAVMGYPNRTATNNQIQHLRGNRLIEGTGKGVGDFTWEFQNYGKLHGIKIDASKRQSGGPVWNRGFRLKGVSGVAYQEPVLISVYTAADATPFYTLRGSNAGTKITQQKHQFIKNIVQKTNKIDHKPDLIEGSHFSYLGSNTTVNGKSNGVTKINRGQVLSVNHSIFNVGTVDADNVKIEYYMSKNNYLDNSDKKVGETTVNTIQSFDREAINKDISVNVAPDKYTLIRVIDPDNNISEYSDDNSRFKTQIYSDNTGIDSYQRMKIKVEKATVPPGAVYSGPNSTPANYDKDNDGKIDQGELVDGLQGYSNDNINQAELVDLLQAYSNS